MKVEKRKLIYRFLTSFTFILLGYILMDFLLGKKIEKDTN